MEILNRKWHSVKSEKCVASVSGISGLELEPSSNHLVLGLLASPANQPDGGGGCTKSIVTADALNKDTPQKRFIAVTAAAVSQCVERDHFELDLRDAH